MNPSQITISYQFVLFCLARNTPTAAPIDSSGIVFGIKRGFVVHYPIIHIIIVLEETVYRTTASIVFIVTPVVMAFRCRFAPGEIIAVAFGRGGTQVANSPFGTAGQTEIHISMFVFKSGNRIPLRIKRNVFGS